MPKIMQQVRKGRNWEKDRDMNTELERIRKGANMEQDTWGDHFDNEVYPMDNNIEKGKADYDKDRISYSKIR